MCLTRVRQRGDWLSGKPPAENGAAGAAAREGEGGAALSPACRAPASPTLRRPKTQDKCQVSGTEDP